MSIFIIKLLKLIDGIFDIQIKGIFKDKRSAEKHLKNILESEINDTNFKIVDSYIDGETEIKIDNDFFIIQIDEIDESHLESYLMALNLKPSDIFEDFIKF